MHSRDIHHHPICSDWDIRDLRGPGRGITQPRVHLLAEYLIS